ncbi:hydrolase [Burkholderia multivorans]|uniref:lecithin retinol acyltransferase family protein n=1 Tax=Burkholderia multivorans TaxID=87883 RepID=UPI000D008F8C|nr:lecithin retinol acyltransferase family protein [Burkholderia multivorans]PRF31947.1 hydrolase [Burkholderia multivorans]
MNQPSAAHYAGIERQCELPVGAHLVTRRTGYVHHGIYVGNGSVIHYAGLSRQFGAGPVEVVSVDDFRAGSELAVVRHARTAYTGMEVAQRALSRVGERRYRLLTNNCEHFCRWCLFGVGQSEQVAACVRNPAHGIAVIAMLVACAMAGKWQAARAACWSRARERSLRRAA